MSIDQERADLLESLAAHRNFLLMTTDRISDEQARQRTTVSALTLGGLVKHVALTERGWAEFAAHGPAADEPAWDDPDPAAWAARNDEFVLRDDETLDDVRALYADVASATDDLVRTIDLDLAWPLPTAPWFPPGATRTARRTFLHIVGETAQHAGHADIIREALDGQKTMG